VERFIPLLHPYIVLVEGECHHRARYPRYPDLALVVERGDATGEELAAVEEMHRRIALNFHGRLVRSATTDVSPEEVARDLDPVQRFAARSA
jgi:hypothetical protein